MEGLEQQLLAKVAALKLQAIAEGQKAYAGFGVDCENPYKKGSVASDAWFEGFQRALELEVEEINYSRFDEEADGL